MEPHRESEDGSNTIPASTLLSSYSQVFLVFFLQVEIPCYILISCATSQVRRAVSLSVVPVQHETMKRRQVHYTSTSNDFHAALFVDEYPRLSIDVCMIGNSPTLHTNLAEPQLSVQL